MRGESYRQGFVGKPEGKKTLGKPKRRWEDNVKNYIEDVGWGHGFD
jgi:hypothetical protein